MYFSNILMIPIDGLVQERCISIANALELHLSCTNPSIWSYFLLMYLSKSPYNRDASISYCSISLISLQHRWNYFKCFGIRRKSDLLLSAWEYDSWLSINETWASCVSSSDSYCLVPLHLDIIMTQDFRVIFILLSNLCCDRVIWFSFI